MKILVACEESQAATIELRKLGHEAYSCDIIEESGGHPEWHIRHDVLPLITGEPCDFTTEDGTVHHMDDKWDMIVAFPPCTYLTVTGNRWFNVSKYGEKALKRARDREEAVKFFMSFVNANCDRIAIENPVGVMSTNYRKPDQFIRPYQFGSHARKKTCLWLKGLPKLVPTNIVSAGETDSYGCSVGASATYATDENGKILSWSDPRTARIRSKTFPGIARAMAEQWTS